MSCSWFVLPSALYLPMGRRGTVLGKDASETSCLWAGASLGPAVPELWMLEGTCLPVPFSMI